MRKLLSAPAIVFKGSGWAKKDFRESRSAVKSDKEPVKAEASDASAGVSSSDGAPKSDSAGAGKSTDGAEKQPAGKSSAVVKSTD